MVNELKNKSNSELFLMLKEAQSRLLKLRFNLAEKQLKNIKEISKTKKEIARIKTEIKLLDLKK